MKQAEHKGRMQQAQHTSFFNRGVKMTKDFPVKKCACCGRNFRLYTQGWVFVRNHRYYCKWSCFNRCCYGKEKTYKDS